MSLKKITLKERSPKTANDIEGEEQSQRTDFKVYCKDTVVIIARCE